jgi:hypothetical protein
MGGYTRTRSRFVFDIPERKAKVGREIVCIVGWPVQRGWARCRWGGGAESNGTEDRPDYLPAEENLVTDLVPSEMACLDNSPGRINLTAVWISREEMVDRLL